MSKNYVITHDWQHGVDQKGSLIWLTQHFAQLRVVQVRVLLRQSLALILRPHHERVHGPPDPRLALPAALAAGAGGARLALHFGVPKRTQGVGPLAVSHSRHHDWHRTPCLGLIVAGVPRIGTAHLCPAGRIFLDSALPRRGAKRTDRRITQRGFWLSGGRNTKQ